MSLSPFVAASRRNHVLLLRMCSSKQSQIDADYSTAENERWGRDKEGNKRASKQCDLSLACNNAATRNRQRQTTASASTSVSNQILTRHENFTFTHATTYARPLSHTLLVLSLSPTCSTVVRCSNWVACRYCVQRQRDRAPIGLRLSSEMLLQIQLRFSIRSKRLWMRSRAASAKRNIRLFVHSVSVVQEEESRNNKNNKHRSKAVTNRVR